MGWLIVWVAVNSLAIIALVIFKIWSEVENARRWDRLDPLLSRMSAYLNLIESDRQKVQQVMTQKVEEIKQAITDGPASGTKLTEDNWHTGKPDRRVGLPPPAPPQAEGNLGWG